MRATLTALIHAESKMGKSWLGATVPAPRLILDSEGRAKYSPGGPKIWWDPRSGPPPRYDGTWETCVAAVDDFPQMELAYRWLRAGEHDFVSCTIDSLMEVQKRCIDREVGSNQMKIQDWGTLLRELESLVRKFRDLTIVNNNKMSVVVFITGTEYVDEMWRPLLQGALRKTVPYFPDVIGYMFKQAVVQEDGTTNYIRSLLVESQPNFVAGDGTGRLPGPIIQNPNFSEMYEILKNYEKEQ